MNKIKQWIRQQNKQYRNAGIYQEVLRQKEEKKAFLRHEVVQESVVQAAVVPQTYGQTIFHRDNLGHNGDEKQKITQIYTELENFFAPQALAT